MSIASNAPQIVRPSRGARRHAPVETLENRTLFAVAPYLVPSAPSVRSKPC